MRRPWSVIDTSSDTPPAAPWRRDSTAPPTISPVKARRARGRASLSPSPSTPNRSPPPRPGGAVLHRTADDLASEGAKVAREGFVVTIAFETQRLVPVVAVIASGLAAEPLGKPVVVLRPCVSGITQRLGFPAMPLPDFQFDLLGLGSGDAAHGIQQLALALPLLGSDGRAALRLLSTKLGHLALVALFLFALLSREVRPMIRRGGDVVIPAGEVCPQRLWLALDRHDSGGGRLERSKPLGELAKTAPVARRAGLDGLIADVDVRSSTGLHVAHAALGKASVQLCP